MNLLSYKVPGPDGTSIEVEAPQGIPTLNNANDLGKIIGWGINILLVIVVLLSFSFILWGALNWITSEGDKTKVESARKTIIFAVVGLVVAFLAFFVINVAGSLFGIDLLKLSL